MFFMNRLLKILLVLVMAVSIFSGGSVPFERGGDYSPLAGRVYFSDQQNTAYLPAMFRSGNQENEVISQCRIVCFSEFGRSDGEKSGYVLHVNQDERVTSRQISSLFSQKSLLII